MLLLWHKLALFSVPLLLITGAGVAYHDGVMADDVSELSKENIGKDVAVKGKVIAVDRTCDHGDDELERNVECFVLRDLTDEHKISLVSVGSKAPEVDSVVVARGELKAFYKMDGGSGSTSWKGGCAGSGTYGSACWDGGSAGWSWPGFELAWVDAGDVNRAWVFK